MLEIGKTTTDPASIFCSRSCVFTLAASWGVGVILRPNSLLSVLVKDTRHLIFYTLESVGEAPGEQPHLTGVAPRRHRRQTGSSHQSGNDRRRESGCQSDQVDFSTAPAGSVPNS